MRNYSALRLRPDGSVASVSIVETLPAIVRIDDDITAGNFPIHGNFATIYLTEYPDPTVGVLITGFTEAPYRIFI